MFGFGALALLAWQSSTIAQDQFRSSRRADFFLGLSAAALLLTHVFGLFLWGAIVAAETVNMIQKRRLLPSRILALILPLIATWTYLPIFRYTQPVSIHRLSRPISRLSRRSTLTAPRAK
jgi:hypothetical protein